MPGPVPQFDRLHAGLEAQDEGLRAYLASTYLRMAGGVALLADAAWSVSHHPALSAALFTPNSLTGPGWFVTIAPLGLVLLLSARINRLSIGAANLVFTSYAMLVGLSLGGLVLAYTGTSLGATSLSAAAGFAAFFTLALASLIVALLVNLVIGSPAFDMMLSGAGLLLFASLTAFDAQKLKRLYRQSAEDERDRLAVLGALALYLDFLNLFLFLLRFTGRRRE